MVCVEADEVGIKLEVEVGVEVVDDVDLENHKIVFGAADFDRGLCCALVVGEVDGRQFGVGGEVEALKSVVLKIKHVEIHALREVDVGNIAALALEYIDFAGVAVDFHYTFLVHVAWYESAGPGTVDNGGRHYFHLDRAVAHVDVEIFRFCR